MQFEKFTTPTVIEQVSYILIAAGAFVFVVSFLGYCGAIRESRCLLTTCGVRGRVPGGRAPPPKDKPCNGWWRFTVEHDGRTYHAREDHYKTFTFPLLDYCYRVTCRRLVKANHEDARKITPVFIQQVVGPGKYGVLLLIILVMEITAGGLAAAYKKEAETESRTMLKNSIKKYYATQDKADAVTLMWNYFMAQMKCCGVDNYLDFKESPKWGTNKTVPEACCVLVGDLNKFTPKDPQCPNNPSESNSYYLKGCYETFYNWLMEHINTAIGVGIGLGLLQLLGIFFAFCLCKSIDGYIKDGINREDRDNTPHLFMFMQKYQVFLGSEPALAWRESGKPFMTNHPDSPKRYSNLDCLVLCSLAQRRTRALANWVSEADL
uniref:(California timema) hypothetical protein n=1 Tax=Timema californicum TaxID=61474 RepID=A0A7R9J6X0_TIMCA|nr:unnamed protein product [Timema californicum]